MSQINLMKLKNENNLLFSASVSAGQGVGCKNMSIVESHKNIIYPSILITNRDYSVYLVTVVWCLLTRALSAAHGH